MEDMLSELHNVYVNGLRESMKLPNDWRYISSRLSKEDFYNLDEVFGAENMSIVAHTVSKDTVRFSMFVSPQGIEKARDWSGSSTE